MDTSAARHAIFSRIRKAQNRSAEPTQAELDAVQQYLRHHPSGPRPAIGSDLRLRFKEQAVRMSDTVDEVATLAEVPAAVARYLDGIGVAKRAVAWETLSHLAW